MELYSPSYGLLIWTILSLGFLALTLVAIFKILKSNTVNSTTKLVWLIAVIFLPHLGSIFYFSFGRKQLRSQ